jgi:outer membrane protein OmpA-like peptidoglycan-associated protein
MLLQNDNRKLLLLAAGIQGAVNPMIVIGLELNSRTNFQDIHIQNDPLWLTPSVLFRTPYYFNAEIGVDISLSQERTWQSARRALEPFRLFGGFVFSSDLMAAKRRAEREKALREKTENERKIRDAQQRAALYARKAQLDSISMAKAREDERRITDSLAQKAREDSITVADLKHKLEEERSKRSDAEKQLLSTGLLLLDAVYFESNKTQISINSFPYLNIIGKMLTKYPKLQIEVSGHTDNIGKYDKNIALSQARAEAVRRYLIQVAPDLLTRISARGYGPTQPKAPNTSAEGRKMNRRTELQVLNKEVLGEYN